MFRALKARLCSKESKKYEELLRKVKNFKHSSRFATREKPFRYQREAVSLPERSRFATREKPFRHQREAVSR